MPNAVPAPVNSCPAIPNPVCARPKPVPAVPARAVRDRGGAGVSGDLGQSVDGRAGRSGGGDPAAELGAGGQSAGRDHRRADRPLLHPVGYRA